MDARNRSQSPHAKPPRFPIRSPTAPCANLAEEAAEFHVDANFVVFDYSEDPEEAVICERPLWIIFGRTRQVTIGQKLKF